MLPVSTWNSAYELVPAQADAPSTLGTTGRATRSDIRERMENEHSSYTTKGGTSGGSVAADFLHKAGSGRVYYQASAPTLRPDGVTALSAADAGRLWIDSDTAAPYLWTGSAWLAIGIPIGGVYIQFPSQSTPASLFGGTWSNISSSYAGDFFRAEGGNASAFESGEQAASVLIPAYALGSYIWAQTLHNTISSYDSISDSSISGGQSGGGTTGSATFSSYTIRPINRTVRIWVRTA